MLPLFITLQTIFGDAKDRLTGEEKGATAVEYGLLVGLVAIVVVVALVGLEGPLNSLIGEISTEINGVNPSL